VLKANYDISIPRRKDYHIGTARCATSGVRFSKNLMTNLRS